jgi:hypothetical protein
MGSAKGCQGFLEMKMPNGGRVLLDLLNLYVNVKVRVKNPCTGPEGSRRLRLPDFKTIGT